MGVTGDWDGNGKTEVGSGTRRRGSSRCARPTGAVSKVTLGALGDRPVTGDWNGDKRTDIGVWTPRRPGRSRCAPGPKSGAATTTKVVLGTSTEPAGRRRLER